jgi:small-conductance mechanosensitive channel
VDPSTITNLFCYTLSGIILSNSFLFFSSWSVYYRTLSRVEASPSGAGTYLLSIITRTSMNLLGVEWKEYLLSAPILGGAVLMALLTHFFIFLALKRSADRTGNVVDESLVKHARRPASILLPLAALLIVLPSLKLPSDILQDMRHAIELGMIATFAWLAISLTAVFDDFISSKFKIDVSDNLLARRVHTRTSLVRHIAIIAILIVAVSAMLMTFPGIRHIGISLFASAGVAGLIAGMAARPMLSNIIAGIQIAMTETIRIDDVVVLEGEWGRVEEISTTNVIVRLWDLRRLVVPLSYFIEHPFENWTHKTADILGTVFLYTDYSVPVEEVRTELYRLLSATEMWDGKTWALQVTNTTDRTMELRALMSAADSATAWNLRCHIREKLIWFLQGRFPQSLPRIRAEFREKPQGDVSQSSHHTPA